MEILLSLSSSGGARGCRGAQAPPTTLASMEAPLQILWRKKKEGENFEEKEEGMRGGRRKGEPPYGSAAARYVGASS